MAVKAKKKAGRREIKIDPNWITPTQFAQEFSLSRSTVQQRLKDGIIKSVSFPSADPNAKRTLRKIPRTEVTRFKALLGDQPNDT